MNLPDPIEGLRRNFATHITDPLGGFAGARVQESGGLVLGDSGTDCDTFNMVANARLGVDADAVIGEAIGFFRGRPFSWWVTTGDLPADLGSRLERAGLIQADTDVVMACRLPIGAVPPSDLRVHVVRTPAELYEYAEVNHRNWSPPDLRVVEFFDRAAPRVLRGDSPFIYVIGEAPDGKIVAVGEGCVTGAVVGLYGISTLADRRLRGYGRSICAALLREAAARGATLAVLQASADGLELYRRLGFYEAGHCTEYKPA